jgi:hypothetical protein
MNRIGFKHYTEIITGLYLGDADAIAFADELKSLNISHIVNLTKDVAPPEVIHNNTFISPHTEARVLNAK